MKKTEYRYRLVESLLTSVGERKFRIQCRKFRTFLFWSWWSDWEFVYNGDYPLELDNKNFAIAVVKHLHAGGCGWIVVDVPDDEKPVDGRKPA